MEEKIAVGEYAYAVDGDAYYVVAHVNDGYIACPVYEDSDGDYVDEKNPVRLAKLFTNPPATKFSEEIKQLQADLFDLKQQEKAQKASLHALQREISHAQNIKKEVALEFPFLETVLRVQKGELNYFVHSEGYLNMCNRVRPVAPEWGESYPDSLCVASFSIDRRGKKPLSVSSPTHFFATEQEATEFARAQTVKALHKIAQGEHNGDIEHFIEEARNLGVDVPSSVMVRKLTKDLEGRMKNIEFHTRGLSNSELEAEKIRAKIAELESNNNHA